MKLPLSSLRQQDGMTIIELLIVIVIVSLLAAVAVPSYRDYVIRTNRTVAKAALQELLTRQESYAADHKGYATSFARLGIGSATTTVYVTSDNRISDSSTGALYTLTLTGNANAASCGAGGAATALAFRLDAAPVATQPDAKCGTICVSSAGERGSSIGAAAATNCWRR